MPEFAARNSIDITVSVWKALLLREALGRLFGRRAAWFWLLFEPVFHGAYLMFLFSVVRLRHVGGFDIAMWILTGLLAWFMFQRTDRQALSAVRANQSLFAYRQVRPVDTVLARAFLEGLLMLVVTVILLAGAGLAGLRAWPADPLMVIGVFTGMWCCGLGLGLISSVTTELSDELGRVLGMVTRPLYLLSGVVFPIGSLPTPYRDWLMLNPLAHGIEAMRLGFAPYYHAVPTTSIGYLAVCGLSLVVVGLVLHIGFAKRIMAE